MERESSLGKMVVNMKESTTMIKSQDGVSFIGLMEENTLETGQTENSMDVVHSKLLMDKRERENGIMAKE